MQRITYRIGVRAHSTLVTGTGTVATFDNVVLIRRNSESLRYTILSTFYPFYTHTCLRHHLCSNNKLLDYIH